MTPDKFWADASARTAQLIESIAAMEATADELIIQQTRTLMGLNR